MATAMTSFRRVCTKNSAQVQVDIKGWLDKLDLASVQMLCGIMDDMSLRIFDQPYFLKSKTPLCDLEQLFFNYYNQYTRG